MGLFSDGNHINEEDKISAWKTITLDSKID
jgi:hypothetical protein